MSPTSENRIVEPAKKPVNPAKSETQISGATEAICPLPGHANFLIHPICISASSDKLDNRYKLQVGLKAPTISYLQKTIPAIIPVKGNAGDTATILIYERPYINITQKHDTNNIVATGSVVLATTDQEEPSCEVIVSQCDPDKRRFFTESYPVICNGASSMGINADFLAALSAYESEWLDDHNKNINNLFGVTRGGRNNLLFTSLQDCMNWWAKNYASWFPDPKPNTMEDFIACLRKGGPNRTPYNSLDSQYDSKLFTRYNQYMCEKQKCLDAN